MRLTIIPSDSLVGVNNEFFAGLDLPACGVPTNIHALQWYETEGELEFVDNPDRTKPQNEIISNLPDWANNAKTLWDEAKAAQVIVLAARAAAQEIGTMPATEL